MLANMSIRKKVTLSGVISAAMAIIIAVIAWNGLRGLGGALEDVTRNATAQKNHLNADMMHEGLRADVLNALYSAANGGVDKDIIKAQTQENARTFRNMIKANRELIGTGPLKAKFAEAETEMERYVSHAESIVAQAFTDPAGAAKQLDAFNDEFKRLEDKLHDVSEFIEDQNRKVQEAGAAEAKADMRAIVIASLFALLAIAVVTVVIPRSIMTKLAQINALGANVASAAAKGDLTVRAEAHGDDEVGALARQMNDILGGFQHSMSEIRDAVAKLVSITDDVASVSRETSEGVNRQHAETEQVATAMNEMTATVQEIAQNSQRTAHSATQGNEAADSGRRVVAQAIESMDVLSQQVDRAVGVLQKLKTDSGNIGVVLDVIRSIAEQTNLLALNAAIEAARAGEQGRGFAVVADEVRTLAQRTQQSTREIQDMIQRLQTGVGEVAATMEQGQQQTRATVQKVSEAGTALDSITAAVSAITDMSTQIATTTEEQSKTTEEINRNISNISGVADQVATSAQRAASATQEMAQLAQRIDGLVKKFKLG